MPVKIAETQIRKNKISLENQKDLETKYKGWKA